MTLRLGDRQVRRARAAAQLLGPPAPSAPATVAEVVGALVGVQAQDEVAAALSVRARSPGVAAADVAAAVSEPRALVLTWTLRGTRHLHRAGDVRWLLGLLGPVFSRPGRRAAQLGVAGEVGDRAVRALRDALAADGPLTRPEVREKLARAGVDPEGQAAVHVVQRAALEGVLCVLPGRGGERYALLDDVVPAAPPVPAADAAAELARRHLAAAGPATEADFRAWSGLPAAAARAAWSAIAGELTEVRRPDGGPLWALTARVDQVRAAAAAGAGPVRLTGGFDNLLLAYADRRPGLHPARARDVNAGGGMVRPVVVADGRVVGTWRHRRGAVEVAPFGRRPPGLDAEVAAVERFLANPRR